MSLKSQWQNPTPQEVLRQNGYNAEDIYHAFNPQWKSHLQQGRPTGVGTIPHLQATLDKIRRLQTRFKLRISHIPDKKKKKKKK
jgi:hypothetical protein